MPFSSTAHIIQDLNYSWIICYLHANGTSIFFICLFLHIALYPLPEPEYLCGFSKACTPSQKREWMPWWWPFLCGPWDQMVPVARLELELNQNQLITTYSAAFGQDQSQPLMFYWIRDLIWRFLFFSPVSNPNLLINQLKPESNLHKVSNVRAKTKPEQKMLLVLNLN